MKVVQRLLTGLASAFIAATATALAAGPGEPTALGRGQSLYARFGCYECHGYAGQGSIMTGPALAGKALSVEHIMRYVRAPAGSMPPYRRPVLSDADLQAIASYITTMRPPQSLSAIPALRRYAIASPAGRQAAAAAPGLKTASLQAESDAPGAGAAEGGRLYAQYCSACHGAARQGGAGPALVGEVQTRSREEITTLLMNPPPGMPKLFPNPMAADKAPLIADFIRSK